MVKRMLAWDAVDFENMNNEDFLQAIRASEGRIILSEVNGGVDPTPFNVTNAEIARAFSADLILLNKCDVQNIQIGALPDTDDPIRLLKRLTGRPVGVNLEPIDTSGRTTHQVDEIAEGRKATLENYRRCNELGFDFLLLTGNPFSGVSNRMIAEAIKLARQEFKGVLMAGKMHDAGFDDEIFDYPIVDDFIDNGADIILFPSPGTKPGVSLEDLRLMTRHVQRRGKLVVGAIGTSQEASSKETIRQIGLWNKIAGVDIHHIGARGYAGMAPYENIYELSLATRGLRHTVRMMSVSNDRGRETNK